MRASTIAVVLGTLFIRLVVLVPGPPRNPPALALVPFVEFFEFELLRVVSAPVEAADFIIDEEDDPLFPPPPATSKLWPFHEPIVLISQPGGLKSKTSGPFLAKTVGTGPC